MTHPSSSHSAAQKSSRLRHTREELLRALEILGPLGNPLPPQLPSPPASRHNSPAAVGRKRKLDPDFEQSPPKKFRTTTAPAPPTSASAAPNAPVSSTVSEGSRRHLPPSSSHIHPPQPRSSSSMRSDPSEDGELREDPAPVHREHVALLQTNVPVRRPRRGNRLPLQYYDDLHDKYHAFGRMLKYSGDTRIWSTYSPRDPGYKPLLNPPHPDTPYHKYGNLIGRLELVDALVCFAYSLWNKDYGRRACHRPSWATIESFLSYSKHKWEQVQDSADEREKAFLGLIWMIEAFIHGRKFIYAAKPIDKENDKLWNKLRADAIAEAEREAAKAERESKPSPGMLPSPESITGASSANSTPTNRSGGTPSALAKPGNGSSGQPTSSLHRTTADQMPPPHLTVPVNSVFIAARKSMSGGLNAARYCMDGSQRFLTLPIMAKHYPRTFSRMVHSTYSATDEHEPDIEDEEGELFWPGQLVTGEGLGWVCTMGKAMIKEFGKNYHYQGLDGVIPKPETGETSVPPGSLAPPEPPHISIQR